MNKKKSIIKDKNYRIIDIQKIGNLKMIKKQILIQIQIQRICNIKLKKKLFSKQKKYKREYKFSMKWIEFINKLS